MHKQLRHLMLSFIISLIIEKTKYPHLNLLLGYYTYLDNLYLKRE